MSDQEEHYLKYLPRNKKRGWEGDEMELQHARDHKNTIIASDVKNDKKNVAVNIQEFYNNEVGKGYQAKHVIRQRYIGRGGDQNYPPANITDMSKPPTTTKSDSLVDQKAKDQNHKKIDALDTYLNNKRLRVFRKELEKIYVEASNTKMTRISQKL